ncbi:MAG TPA: DNA-binding domain-containing protein [Polyangiaceae bacterium]|nr:DNA-binding domain-containing protein [Polyangiaceae bacterium]
MNPGAQVPERNAVAEPVAERERASATPVARETHGLRPPTAPAPRTDGPAARSDALERETRRAGALPMDKERTSPTLRSRQAWFANAVMSLSNELEPTAEEVESILTAGPSLSARDRLGVYRRAYVARLVECLADDYPSLQTTLGEDRFEILCRAYVAHHPSTSPSLNAYGRLMGEFCRDRMGPDLASELSGAGISAGFLADLAALEWAIVEVIHARSVDPLTPSGLADVPVERWADARLEMTPAFRLLRFAYPVNTYLQALREGKALRVPGAAPAAAAVVRSGTTVWRMDLSEPMCDLLQALASGETLGVSLERAALAFGDVAEDVAVKRVMAWFREWVSSGVFSRVMFD